MQGTVARFDDETRAGAVLTDDGVEIPFMPEALAGTGLRFLRPGQRVRLDISDASGTSRIEHLQILTLP